MISCDLSFLKNGSPERENQIACFRAAAAEGTGPVSGIIWKRLSQIPLRIRHQVYLKLFENKAPASVSFLRKIMQKTNRY